jgi:hypothetical protein
MPKKSKRSIGVRRKRTRLASARKKSSTRSAGPDSPRSERLWVKRSTCPTGTHSAVGYANIHSPVTHCVRDCAKWSPPRHRGKMGRCLRMKKGSGASKGAGVPKKMTVWTEQLMDYWKDEQTRNPEYSYKDAMIDFSSIWKSIKRGSKTKSSRDKVTEKAYN